LWLRLPFNNDSLYGHIRMGAVSNVPGLTTVKLNAAGLTVDSCFCDQAAVAFVQAADTLFLTVPSHGAGQRLVTDVHYRLGSRGGGRIGYYWYPKGYNANTLHAVGYAMSEPQDARCWMPCFDEPWDKADSGCALYVTVPDSYQVAGNGLLADTVRAGGRMTWHWVEANPIATYLMCFTASRFAMWSDTSHTVSGTAVPLSYFVWPEDSAQSRSVFATVPAMVRLLDSTFADYPFEKYGMAAVYPFAFGGMEHQSMTTIHRNWIPNNSQTGILHELAHMWYGDLVTCGTWADIWLNEGFASYLQVYYDEWLGGQKPGAYMVQRFSQALSGNANFYPIYDPPMPLLFDYSMEYAKGAWVLQGLRWVMGDTLFFPMMRAYADSFAYGNAVSAEFQGVAEDFYGGGLVWFFGQWLHRPGHPRYATAIYYDTDDTLSARIKIRQTSIDGLPYKMPLALACSTAAGVGGGTVAWDSTDLAGDFIVSSPQPIRRVLLDPDNWVLKEWADSLPHLSQLSTIVQEGNSAVMASWRKFRADTTIAGYNLYRGGDSLGPLSRVNPSVVTDTCYIDTSVWSGSEYYYAVAAVNGADQQYQTHLSNVLHGIAGGVNVNPSGGPTAPMLTAGQAAPNPSAAGTTIEYSIPLAGRVTVRIYNIIGQPVRTLFRGELPAGRHRAEWDGRSDSGRTLNSGLYFCRIECGGRSLVRRLNKVS